MSYYPFNTDDMTESSFLNLPGPFLVQDPRGFLQLQHADEGLMTSGQTDELYTQAHHGFLPAQPAQQQVYQHLEFTYAEHIPAYTATAEGMNFTENLGAAFQGPEYAYDPSQSAPRTIQADPSFPVAYPSGPSDNHLSGAGLNNNGNNNISYADASANHGTSASYNWSSEGVPWVLNPPYQPSAPFVMANGQTMASSDPANCEFTHDTPQGVPSIHNPTVSEGMDLSNVVAPVAPVERAKRKRAAPKAAKAPVSKRATLSPEDIEAKREEAKRRNCEAARKCRQNKLELIRGLRAEERRLRLANASLVAEQKEMMAEVFDISNAAADNAFNETLDFEARTRASLIFDAARRITERATALNMDRNAVKLKIKALNDDENAEAYSGDEGEGEVDDGLGGPKKRKPRKKKGLGDYKPRASTP